MNNSGFGHHQHEPFMRLLVLYLIEALPLVTCRRCFECKSHILRAEAVELSWSQQLFQGSRDSSSTGYFCHFRHQNPGIYTFRTAHLSTTSGVRVTLFSRTGRKGPPPQKDASWC